MYAKVATRIKAATCAAWPTQVEAPTCVEAPPRAARLIHLRLTGRGEASQCSSCLMPEVRSS
jgi:hypothetical protein